MLGSIRIRDPEGISSIRKNLSKTSILIRTPERCISQPYYIKTFDPEEKPLIQTEISLIQRKILEFGKGVLGVLHLAK